jgi:hypothetical protein
MDPTGQKYPAEQLPAGAASAAESQYLPATQVVITLLFDGQKFPGVHEIC